MATNPVFENDDAKQDMTALLEILRPLLASGRLKSSRKAYNRQAALKVAIQLIAQAPVAEAKVDSRIRPTRVGYLSVVE